MNKRTKQSSGFTLIELMVVVAIVSILSTLAVPRFKVFMAKSYKSESAVTVKQMKLLFEVNEVAGQVGPSQHGSNYYILSNGFGRSHFEEHGDCNYSPGGTGGTNTIGFEFNSGDCAKLKHSYMFYYRPNAGTGEMRVYPGAKLNGGSSFESTYFGDCVPAGAFHHWRINLTDGAVFSAERLISGSGLPEYCY
jgi:prepilin-type N-terminal cleavage/methylation domain-containing protein